MTVETDLRRARGHLRRELILRSAVAVIDARGGGALTHRAAAHQAGVSLASVTYHFPSANDLAAATYEWAGRRLLEYIGRAASWPSVTVQAFPDVVGRVSAELAEQRRGELITVNHMSMAAADDDALRDLSAGFRARTTGVFDGYVEDGASPLLLAAVNGILVYSLSNRNVPAEWVAAAVATLVRKFTLPPGGEPS